MVGACDCELRLCLSLFACFWEALLPYWQSRRAIRAATVWFDASVIPETVNSDNNIRTAIAAPLTGSRRLIRRIELQK